MKRRKPVMYAAAVIVAGLCLLAAPLALSAIRTDLRECRDYRLCWARFAQNPAAYPVRDGYPHMEFFRRSAENYNLPTALLVAVARGESNFNPRAQSDKNCHGIMQIQWPGTAKQLDITVLEHLYDPATNIDAGARYIRWLMDKYNNDVTKALGAYYVGPGNMDRGKLQNHADWYAEYIYRHLTTVVGRVYRKLKYCNVMDFNTDISYAMRFADLLSDRIKGVEFEVFKCNYIYFVAFPCGSDAQRAEVYDKIKNELGVVHRDFPANFICDFF
jgi:soluble lytic murein transglycosylase-like protein